MLQHVRQGLTLDKLAIITNAEIYNDRASVAKSVVQEIFQHDIDYIKVFAGKPEPKKIPHSKMEPICADLLEIIPMSQIIGDLKEFIDFIDLQKKEGYKIIWLCIGCMTNLREMLSKNILNNSNVHAIVQMGGVSHNKRGPEKNIRLDPLSCQYVLQKCLENSVKFYMITVDTLYDRDLEWVDGETHQIKEPWQSILKSAHPAVYKLITSSIGSHPLDFTSNSYLYHTFTVLWVIHKKYDISSSDSFLPPMVPAVIDCRRNGQIVIGVDYTHLYGSRGVFNTLTDKSHITEWWSIYTKYYKGVTGIDKFHPIQVSFGPLHISAKEYFFSRLRELLTWQPLAQTFTRNVILEAVTKHVKM